MKECNNEGAISLAEVRSRVDPARSGSFRAKVSAEGNEEQTIYYVSPYGSNAAGAFIAIPEVGTEVLVCKPTGSSSWYYMGTTFASEPKDAEPTGSGGELNDATLMPVERADPEMYKARGTPMRYLFRSPEGAGILMSDEYNPEFINKKTEITSTGSKKITLHDGPTIDAITIDSGNGSRITLTDDPQNQNTAARSIQVESVGPQKYICTESQTDILVGAGGRELQLLNNANGVPYGNSVNAGNVNIQSKWKDVNVFTQAEQGRIFIECLNESGNNQQIIIETNGTGGTIRLKTNGKIDIAADSIGIEANTIDIKAASNLNIESPTINLNGTVNAPEINSKLNGDITGKAEFATTAGKADAGTPVPITVPAPNVDGANPDIGDTQSTYNNIGVTTY